MIYDLPFFIDLHQTTQSQTVLPFVERTDPIGERMRKHRNHPVRQIDAGSPLLRLPVQSTVLLHIIRDVSNVNTQIIVPVANIQGNRIVQIFGVLPVDRHHRNVS